MFCSNLDLNTAGGRETVFVTLCRNLRLMHAVLLRRAGPHSQLPFLIYYLITMYYNSWWRQVDIAIGHYFKSISTLIDTKITRDVRDLKMSTESFHSFLCYHPLIRYQSTEYFQDKIRALQGPKKPSFKFFFSIAIDLFIQ